MLKLKNKFILIYHIKLIIPPFLSQLSPSCCSTFYEVGEKEKRDDLIGEGEKRRQLALVTN